LVKEIAHFRTYILSTHIISYVSHSPIKMFLNQQFREEIWENNMAKLQEYDMEIKLLKVIKEQGLCKKMIGIEVVNINSPHIDDTTMQVVTIPRSEWYKDIILYLKFE